MKDFKSGLSILVDFDGTVVTHDYPLIGKDIGAIPILKELVRNGHGLILFSMRSGKELDEAVKWFKNNDIPLYGIQTNPTQHEWTTSPKAYGQLIIDDIGLGCPTKFDLNLSNRKFVDWVKVEQMLKELNLIVCPLCGNRGEYVIGGSFGGSVQIVKCNCKNM